MTPDSHVSADAGGGLGRYHRQMLFDEIGESGQRKLLSSRVLLVGCGALGSVLANTLVRAGVGYIRICDRDYIERDNLQRQILFDEDDIVANLPKAEAAARKLRRANPDVTVEAAIVDVNHTNIAEWADGVDLLLDGTDNFETRYLINDHSVSSGCPWIYGAVIGASGLCMPILPDETPCLRCLFNEPPPAEMNPTCDTAGVIGPAVQFVASLQAVEAMKLLSGRRDAVSRRLFQMDVWTGRLTALDVGRAKQNGDCRCCGQRIFEFLDGTRSASTVSLCGRNAVQIRPPSSGLMDLRAIADRLQAVASDKVYFNEYLLKFYVGDDYELTLFQDGRAIVKGTDDPAVAKSIHAKYIGA